MTRKSLSPATGLQNGITRPPTRRPEPATPLRTVGEAEPSSSEDEAGAPESKVKPKNQAKQDKPAPYVENDTVVGTSIRIPIALIEKLGERPRGTTIFEAIANALETQIEELVRLVETEIAAATTSSSLFPNVAAKSARKEPVGTLTFRTPAGNLRQLDHLVRVSKAANRSQLITAALRGHRF